jgi:predicted RNA-binding protein with PIN domain
MHVIIDGYNVIGIDHGDIAGQRERLVAALVEYRKTSGHDITIVFDGGPSRFRSSGAAYSRGAAYCGEAAYCDARTAADGVAVIYSGAARKADDVIKQIVSERAHKWIVVTSDRDIASNAWAFDCVPVRSEDFAKKLFVAPGRGLHQVPDEDDDKDADTDSARKAGNPRTLSRKDKLVKQALDKL